jgi:hypothetical protein
LGTAAVDHTLQALGLFEAAQLLEECGSFR